jgi:hypothetical protein
LCSQNQYNGTEQALQVLFSHGPFPSFVIVL